MNNLERAKELLKSSESTCVLLLQAIYTEMQLRFQLPYPQQNILSDFSPHQAIQLAEQHHVSYL